MNLWAISDLHVSFPDNRRAVAAMPAHPDDWLILAGDICETVEDLTWVLEVLGPRFRRLVWVPGNHELWRWPRGSGLAGQAKYEALVAACRDRDVLTPEDPYPEFVTGGQRYRIAPLFLLYDYTFAPDDVPPERAIAWALEHDILCADEALLQPDPFPSRAQWCRSRCDSTEQRLSALRRADDAPLVLVNHFPLRRDLARLPLIPRFCIWCGTRRTEDWHVRFGACAVVTGHLHIPSSRVIDGTRFEEVSLGYPRQWGAAVGIGTRLRQILPKPVGEPGRRGQTSSPEDL